jgi:hypothetical protein
MAIFIFSGVYLYVLNINRKLRKGMTMSIAMNLDKCSKQVSFGFLGIGKKTDPLDKPQKVTPRQLKELEDRAAKRGAEEGAKKGAEEGARMGAQFVFQVLDIGLGNAHYLAGQTADEHQKESSQITINSIYSGIGHVLKGPDIPPTEETKV